MKRRLRSLLDRLAASCKDLALAAWRLYPTMLRPCAAPVAQLDRALPSEGRGREFESRRVRHFGIRRYHSQKPPFPRLKSSGRVRRSHAPCDFGAVLALDHSKVMPALQIKPELVRLED